MPLRKGHKYTSGELVKKRRRLGEVSDKSEEGKK